MRKRDFIKYVAILLFEKMESDSQEIINCADDNKFRKYCDVFDKVAKDRCYNNHLKS